MLEMDAEDLVELIYYIDKGSTIDEVTELKKRSTVEEIDEVIETTEKIMTVAKITQGLNLIEAAVLENISSDEQRAATNRKSLENTFCSLCYKELLREKYNRSFKLRCKFFHMRGGGIKYIPPNLTLSGTGKIC